MATAQKADSLSTSWRLASLTKGSRSRIALAALFGLGAVTTGVARLSLSGTAVAMVFEQQPFMEILLILLGVLALPMLRIVFTMAQQFIAHGIAGVPTHLVTADVADLDGDGRPDIVAGGLHMFGPYDRLGRVTLWANRGPRGR